jgi:serine/threonine protein kinase
MLTLIGQGEYGKVYRGCFNKECLYKYARKNSKYPLKLEYDFMVLMEKMYPGSVVKPLGMKDNMLFMNYIEQNEKSKMRNFKKVLKKVLKVLMRIKKVYPSFRHNDLKWDNIFVNSKGEAFIGDFGLANINMKGYMNPLVQSGEFIKNGTGPKSSPKFDIHLLLNSIYVDPNVTPAARKFIESVVPKEYLGENSDKIKNFRLRYNVSHEKFPTEQQIFSML